ncbi:MULTISPECIES: ArnT family glycosyltransferase [unclassified Vibrio]|uniref:ArnT family glycosyltransferase n=1 Tax=unclassified Vibrio TaxID=2614977 RepID=UPI0035506DDB
MFEKTNSKPNILNRDIKVSRSSIMLTLIFLAIVLRVYTAFNYEVNWDEFYYLSFVHQFLAGESISSFQTFHVHVFTWLSWVSDNEVNQIIVARNVMLCLQIATGFFIFRICRRHLGRSASLFAVLAYFSFSFVIRMGASFRTDPIATFCLMASLDYLLKLEYSFKRTLITALLTAIAFLITLKSVFYFPTIILISLLSIVQSSQKRRTSIILSRYFILVTLLFLSLYFWHSQSITSTTENDAISMLSGANKTLNHNLFFPRANYFIYTLGTDLGFWFTLVCGVYFCLSSTIKNNNIEIKLDYLKLMTLILPLLSILIYRNAFPYFYSFILAPSAIYFGLAWEVWNQRKTRKRYMRISRGVVFLFVFNLIFQSIYLKYSRNLDYQYHFINVVQKIFPEPVAYIDRCSMISSYPQKGFFMSSWGMDNYLIAGQPILKLAIEDHEPKFLIVNSEYLEFIHSESSVGSIYLALLEEDRKAIKNNYISHWNELYVAGKELLLTQEDNAVTFTLNISGNYTLESDSKVIINNKVIHPQEIVALSKGKNTIKIFEDTGTYTLRWGENLYRPKESNRESRMFSGF